MRRTKTKSKEMTLDCARDPGRTRTELARHTGGCPVLLSRDPGITPNSGDAETNGQENYFRSLQQNWIPRNIIVVHQTCSRGFSE